MNRLTVRIENNVYYAKGKYSPTTLCAEMETHEVRECMKKLADYEDTGLEPKEVNKYFDGYVKEIERLRGIIRHFEVLKHQERLIELPCKVGDTAYRIAIGRHIEDFKVKSFTVEEYGVFANVIYKTPISYVTSTYPIEDLFFTKEEAEKALKGAEHEPQI